MKTLKVLILHPTIIYLLRETILILGFSYFILAGGTLNGVMRFGLRLSSQIFLALAFFAWLISRMRQQERLARSSLDAPLLVFLGIQFLTAALSTDPRRSLAFCGQWVACALWFYLMRDLLCHGWPAELFIKSLLIVSGILVGLGLAGIGAQWLKWVSLGDYALPLPLLQQRFYSLLGDPNMTAALLNLLWPLALARLAASKSRSARILLGLWMAATLITQLLTRSQGGLAGLIAATISTLIALLLIARPARLFNYWTRIKARKWSLGLLLLLAILAAGSIMTTLIIGGDLLGARGDLWSAAWQIFARSPLWGSGPFTFGTQLMLYESTPPYPAYPHAHNFWLNTAAETGLLGLAAAVGAAAAFGTAMCRVWRKAGRAHRQLMAGAIGSLFGFAAHSLADNHIILPGIGLVVVAVLVLALGNQSTPKQPACSYSLSIAWLGLPALILATGSLLSGAAYWRYDRGRQLAQTGEWLAATSFIEEAAQSDPKLAFYWLQNGYARSVLAAEAPDKHLSAAIESYKRAIALEPNFSLSHANLGSLYWTAGRRAEAVSEMEQAVQLAPDCPLYRLNLGRYYETTGQETKAAAEYYRFLNSNPHLIPAHYWRQTPFRRHFAEEWQAAHPPPPVPENAQTAAEHQAAGRSEYAAGRHEAALAAFERAYALDATQSETAHGLGLAYMALGNYKRADFFFSLANIFLVRSNRPEPLLDWGQLAYRQGEIELAIARYEAALGLVQEYSVYGPGTLGWSPYANFLFQRESIAQELAPQLVRIDVTDELAGRYLELAVMYEELNDKENAAATYRRVLRRVPDLNIAQERLRMLEIEID